MGQQIEKWKPIAETDGWYEVSSLGRVRSWKRRGSPFLKTPRRADEPIVLSPKMKNGYQEVCIRIGHTKCMRRVNRLVATAFHGPAPHIGCQAAHLNGNRGDDRWNNLMWATPRQNSSHIDLHGTRQKRPPGLLTVKLRAVDILAANDWACSEIAKVLSLSTRTVQLATRRLGNAAGPADTPA